MCGKKNQLGDPLSPNRIGQVITMSKQVFGDAIKHNLIRFNPAENVEVPKRIKPKVEPPGKADVLAVLEQVTPEFKLLFLMNSLTGLRRGEILALQWRDIDWLNGEISVCRSICKAKATDGVHRFQWVVGPTKTGKDRRVGLPSVVLEHLKEFRRTAAPQKG